MCTSETKLSNVALTTDLKVNGFSIPIRKGRLINKGGDLIIYVKNNLCFKTHTDLESNDIENIWIEVNSLKNNFLVGLFYRAPNSFTEHWSYFDETIELATEQNTDVMIFGDFNQDMLQAT